MSLHAALRPGVVSLPHGWGHDLAGSRLGLLGYGVLGKATAQIARAFGMEVIVYNRSPLPDAAADGVHQPLWQKPHKSRNRAIEAAGANFSGSDFAGADAIVAEMARRVAPVRPRNRCAAARPDALRP